MDEWAKGIEGLTDEQLVTGIEKVRSDCTWPPSIAEFRKLCLDDGSTWEHRTGAYRDSSEVLGLPELKAQPKVQKKEMKEIRKTLGMKK